jgi:iron(III) transport system permease protein
MGQMTNSVARRRIFPSIDRWISITILIAVLVILPILSIGIIALFPKENIWPHLISTSLPRYLSNSIILMISVGILSAIIGTLTAWLVAMYSFTGRRALQWMLLMPLALPAYIGAYALVDFMEYAGPFQTGLRTMFGWTNAQDYFFPEVRSRGAAIFVLTFSFYPYVYLLARVAFREHSARAYEVSRALGCGPWRSFIKVGLPLARPSIAAGSAIVMMETLNDFGTVEFFAVQTLTTGIFTVWLEASNVGGAAQIACVIMTLVLVLVVLEKYSRRDARTYKVGKGQKNLEAEALSGGMNIAVSFFCMVPVLLGFFFPVGVLLTHVVGDGLEVFDMALWRAALTSIWVSGLAAIVTVCAGILLVYGARRSLSRRLSLLIPITTIGYAAPGAVLAIGIIVPLALFENKAADFVLALTGYDPGLFFTGTVAAIVFAYFVRFFAIAYGGIETAFGRMSPNMGAASRSLGVSPMATLLRVHIPLLKGSILTAGLLIFVDCIKELPATLLLRPFGLDTLATHTYTFASLEDINGAAPSALVIVLVGLVSVTIVARSIR